MVKGKRKHLDISEDEKLLEAGVDDETDESARSYHEDRRDTLSIKK